MASNLLFNSPKIKASALPSERLRRYEVSHGCSTGSRNIHLLRDR